MEIEFEFIPGLPQAHFYLFIKSFIYFHFSFQQSLTEQMHLRFTSGNKKKFAWQKTCTKQPSLNCLNSCDSHQLKKNVAIMKPKKKKPSDSLRQLSLPRNNLFDLATELFSPLNPRQPNVLLSAVTTSHIAIGETFCLVLFSLPACESQM